MFLVIVIILSLTIFSFKYIGKNNVNNKMTVNNDERSNEEPIIDDDNNLPEAELTQDVTNSIEMNVDNYLFSFDFVQANDYIYEATKDKKIDMQIENDRKIELKHQESAISAHFPALVEMGDIETVKELIRTLKDEDIFFASTMFLDTNNRKSFIVSSDSFNPVSEDGIKVISKEELQSNDEISTIFKSIENTYKYVFQLDKNELIAYVVRNNDKLYIYKITELEEGSTTYMTIGEWDDFLRGNNINKEENINVDDDLIEEEQKKDDEKEEIIYGN